MTLTTMAADDFRTYIWSSKVLLFLLLVTPAQPTRKNHRRADVLMLAPPHAAERHPRIGMPA